MPSKEDDVDEEWPMFLPVPETIMRRVDEHFAAEEREALPLKERGNELYQERRFEEALVTYTKALHCFSIHHVTMDKMVYGLLLGTLASKCGADSNLQILGGVAPQIARRIASYLIVQPYLFYRLPAVICGNISIVLRALGRQGAFDAARKSLSFDPTYTKALSLMQKAVVDPQSPFPVDSRSAVSTTLKQKAEVVKLMMSRSSNVGMLAVGLLPDPIEFLILEQRRAYKELERIMSSDVYLRYPSDPAPKHVSLQITLVPFKGTDKTYGQWLVCTTVFLDTSRQGTNDFLEIGREFIPEITHLHFARADPENGDDTELPPSGKASPRAVAFVLERVPQVALILKDRFGLTVKQIRCGQGLKNLTGPNGPDDNVMIGLGPLGLPTSLSPVESRAGPAKAFREIDLGPDSERLWAAWDDFSRDMKVLPTYSSLAEERAIGRG